MPRSQVVVVTDSLLLYSFSVGLVAAFNPCGFPLLPAYLMLSGGEAGARPVGVRITSALVAGLCMTLGFILVFGPIGLAFDLGFDLTESWVPWVMMVVGAACVLYGFATALGRSRGPRLPLPKVPKGRGRVVTFVVFGVAFAVASLSCAFPLFIAAVAGVFKQNGTTQGVGSALAYAIGMGLVVTCVSLASAGARQIRAGRIRKVEPILTRLAGVVLVAVGAYLILYWANDRFDPLHTPAAVRFVERVQSHIQSTVGASPRLTGLIVGIIVIAALAVAAAYAARPQPPAAAPQNTQAAAPQNTQAAALQNTPAGAPQKAAAPMESPTAALEKSAAPSGSWTR